MPATTVRPPQQQRSRESLRRLVEAALDVLEEGGWDGFTMSAVAGRAGVSVGTVYNRFSDKDELVAVVYDAFIERLSDAGRPSRRGVRGDELELEELVERLVSDLAHSFRLNHRLLRVFAVRASVDSVMAGRATQHIRILGREFVDALLSHRQAFSRPNPRLAADVAYRMVFDVFSQRMMMGEVFESGLAIRWDELIAELSAACVAYLRSG